MKVAIIADPLDHQHAGIHVYTKQLIEALDAANEVSSLVLVRTVSHPIGEKAKSLVVDKIIKFLPHDPLRTLWLIGKKLKNIELDIVIEPAHFGPFNLPKHVKRITVIHDLTPIYLPHLHRFASSIAQRIFMPSVFRKSDVLVANSSSTLADMRKYAPAQKNKFELIYPNLREDFKDVAPLHKKPYFLFVGTIEPRKNLHVLIKAFDKFCAQNGANYRLRLCGMRGWRTRKFETAFQQSPYKHLVDIMGFLPMDELIELYSKAFAFIFPSEYEGFGFPVLEAMACQTPVILANNSSLKEVGGSGGLYFETGDYKTLAMLMQDLVKDENLYQSELERANLHLKKFINKNFAQQWVELLKNQVRNERSL